VLAGESYNLGGDIVVTADGKPLAGLNALRDLVAAKKPGDTIALVVYRNGKKTNLLVKLGRQPGSATG
jgi:S1-C subfamily serine protease